MDIDLRFFGEESNSGNLLIATKPMRDTEVIIHSLLKNGKKNTGVKND